MQQDNNQKSNKALTILIILIIIGILASCTQAGGGNKPVFNYKQGDVIYPDYACSDTLIVRDADSLNLALYGLLISSDKGTDSDIDSVLHRYCKYYHHRCRWDVCPYKGVVPLNYGKAVREYVDGEGQAYSIDMLHLYFPTAEYEELEEMLEQD